MCKKYTLTLKFPLRCKEEIDCEKLANGLQRRLRDWQNDGRYCFSSEMITRGLNQCLRTAKWIIEGRKRHDESEKPWINPEPEVSIAKDKR